MGYCSVRTWPLAWLQADVAQLVERNLAKVEVASSSLVVRSEKGRRSPPWWSGREARQRTANPSTRVQIPSRPRIRAPAGKVLATGSRAIGAAVARFPDTEEVIGSIPVSPTRILQTQNPGFGRGFSVDGLPGETFIIPKDNDGHIVRRALWVVIVEDVALE